MILRATLAASLLASTAAMAIASDFDLRAETDETVYFRGWQYKTAIVEDNIARYVTELGGNIDYATVTGDYPAIMESNLMAGAELDILYANPTQAARYYEGGWVTPASDLPNADEILADMYPNIRDAMSYRGALLGLSYFVTTRGVIHVNTERYAELGYGADDYPADWDALYDQMLEMHAAGAEAPFLPHWLNEWFGISWAFTFEVLNRGGAVADPETHAPMLTADGPAGETLRDWRALWQSGAVPEEVLTYSEAAYLDAFASGRYVMSPQQAYDLRTFNQPDRSPMAGHVGFLPYQGQSWGLLDAAVYVMTSRDRSEDHTRDVMRALSWYGYEDQNGEPFVAERWLNESMLFSAYRTVMESEEARMVIAESLADPAQYDALMDVYVNTPYPAGSFNVVWAPEFNSWLKDELQAFLLEDRSVEETIDAINGRIEMLNRRYGL